MAQQPPPGLTPLQRMQWNSFIDFLEKEGVKGSPLLDQRDKNLGKFYFQKFVTSNPGITLRYEDVPRIQQELQDYRANLVNQWKNGKVSVDSVKTEDDIMPGLSQVDGWLGSKTSSYKYPVSTDLLTKNGNATATNYGTSRFEDIKNSLQK